MEKAESNKKKMRKVEKLLPCQRTMMELRDSLIRDQVRTKPGKKFEHLLYLLLVTFGALYFLETVKGGIFAKDLWANLFATLITVLLVDKIIKRAELGKSTRSMRVVKVYILRTLSKMTEEMKAPENWRKRLKEMNPNWDAYHRKVREAGKRARKELEEIVDKHSHLMDAELMDNILVMIGLLNDFEINKAFSKITLENLPYFVNLVAGVVNISAEIVKANKLPEGFVGLTKFKGEPPHVYFSLYARERAQPFYSDYQKTLKELVRFRDRCYDLENAVM